MSRQILTAFGASAVLFLFLDAAWLSVMGERLYRPVIGEIMADKVRLAPAVAFYVIYLAGLNVLAVHPALASGDVRQAALRGAILGLVAYATYDLTNQATLRTWSTTLTLCDLAWGTFVSAAAALCGALAARSLAR